MNPYLAIKKFSFGMGDRFGHQGRAQLQACIQAAQLGMEFAPIWNKSNREHTFIGTEPSSVGAEADAAVKALGWIGSYHVDADHIRRGTVDRFIALSDFFTIDKLAAKMVDRYYAALKKHEAVIAKNVTENLFERHMKPFLPGA
jgi:hypothetical protein